MPCFIRASYSKTKTRIEQPPQRPWEASTWKDRQKRPEIARGYGKSRATSILVPWRSTAPVWELSARDPRLQSALASHPLIHSLSCSTEHLTNVSLPYGDEPPILPIWESFSSPACARRTTPCPCFHPHTFTTLRTHPRGSDLPLFCWLPTWAGEFHVVPLSPSFLPHFFIKLFTK